MKKFALLVAMLALPATSFAFDCQQLEAQFIGNVSAVVMAADSCTVSVSDISFYHSSALCPLAQEDLENAGMSVALKDGVCPYQVGDAISGVAASKNGVIVLD